MVGDCQRTDHYEKSLPGLSSVLLEFSLQCVVQVIPSTAYLQHRSVNVPEDVVGIWKKTVTNQVFL